MSQMLVLMLAFLWHVCCCCGFWASLLLLYMMVLLWHAWCCSGYRASMLIMLMLVLPWDAYYRGFLQVWRCGYGCSSA